MKMPQEQLPNSQNNNKNNPEISRRDFVKKMGAGAIGGMLLRRENFKIQIENSEKTNEIIAKCQEIIEKEQYEQILENPYLVFTLYCSEHAVDKMKPPFKFPSEEVISTIYPLITRQFRENYLTFLKNLILATSPSESMNLTRESLPVESIDWRGATKNTPGYHQDALDLFIAEGSPVYSMSRGIVVLAENGWDMENEFSTSSMRGGNTVIVFSGEDKSFYRYAHLRETAVQTGTILPSGTRIGTVGDTGINASKPGHGGHLHLEINKYDQERSKMTATPLKNLQEKIKALLS